MNKGVMGPLLITAVVVAVGNGWILAAWTGIYNASHGIGGAAGAASAPQPGSTPISAVGTTTSSGGTTTPVLPRIKG